MASMSGTAGSVVYNDGTNTVIANIAEWSLDLSQTPVEVTTFGDAASRYVPNLRRATGTFSGSHDGASAVQTSLRSGALNGSTVRLLFYTDATEFVDAVEAYVLDHSPSVSVSGRAGIEYSFQVSKRIETDTNLYNLLLENGDLWLMENGNGWRLENNLEW